VAADTAVVAVAVAAVVVAAAAVVVDPAGSLPAQIVANS
jgi:hypothetical protein